MRERSFLRIATITALVGLADPARAAIQFADEQRVAGPPGSRRPVGVAIADLGSPGDPAPDGNPDVAVAESRSNDIVVLFGDGSGSGFTAVSLGTLPTARRPLDLVAGDFDGSGNTDLAVAACGDPGTNSDRLVVIRDRAVATADELLAGDCPTAVVAGDLDSDLDVDLAVTVGSPFAAAVSVFRGDGAGGFTGIGWVASPGDGLTPPDLAIGDFGGPGSVLPDGIPDFVFPMALIGYSKFFAGTGDLTTTANVAFPGQDSLFTGLGRSQAVAVADFDRDGNDDVAIAARRGPPRKGPPGPTRKLEVEVFLFGPQFGPGFVFEQPIPLDGGKRPTAIVAGNVSSDTDGRPDLVVVSSQLREVLIFEGRGGDAENAGQLFEAPVRVAVGHAPRAAQLGSLEGGNADPDLDIAVTNYGTDDVSVLRNDSPVCGNGVTESGEACDPPGSPIANPAGHVCGPTCRIECASPRLPGPCPP